MSKKDPKKPAKKNTKKTNTAKKSTSSSSTASAGAKVTPSKSVPNQVGVTPSQLKARATVVQKTAPKSAQSASNSGESVDRRQFVKWLVVGWAAFAAVLGGYGSIILRYLFPNVLFEPKQSFRAGYPDDFVVGEVSERFKEAQATWIVRDSEKIYALSTVCTHLGCTPNWSANEGKFKCPCHGSGFYKTGINFEGPAPRPLERFKIALADDGEIVVDKTKKFQQEKGEWDDPESYILA